MLKNLIIRQETPADYHRTERMVMRSFWNKYWPGCTEHFLTRIIRIQRLQAGPQPHRGVERPDRRGDLLYKGMDRRWRGKAGDRHVRASGGGADDGG